MIDFAKVRAIDFHTHAEEACGCHTFFVDPLLESAVEHRDVVVAQPAKQPPEAAGVGV